MLVLLYFFPYSGPETGATEQDASSGKSQNERPIRTDLGRAQRKAPKTEPISRLLFIIGRRYRCRNDLRAQASRAGWRVQAFLPEAKTLAEGQFTCPEHFDHPWGSGNQRPLEPKKMQTYLANHTILLRAYP